MKAEDLRIGERRQARADRKVVLILSNFGTNIKTGRRELKAGSKSSFADVSLEKRSKCYSIFTISDSTSIVTLSNTVMDSIEGSLVRVLIDEDVKLLSRNTEIRLIELISVSPSKGTVQFTLLDNSVEEQ